MQRRKLLKLTGAALATTVGTGYVVAENQSNRVQEQGEPIEFENSEELLLEQAALPENNWTRSDVVEGEVFDVRVTYRRELGDSQDAFWLVISSAAGRDTETEATELYEELATAFTAEVGEARIMNLDLASEAVIAGYDGRTLAIFRDVNCVGSVAFTDCGRIAGCASHVGRTEELAQAQRQSWRGGTVSMGGNGSEGTTEEQPTVENVDEVDGQVTLAYGETAHVSNGVETTVYEGTFYDQMGDEVPEERDRFLVVPVEAVNTNDEPRRIPDQIDSWEVLFGDQQLSNVFRSGALDAEDYQALEGGDVQAGVRREGVLLFEVDEGFETGDIDVLWQDSYGVAANLEGDIDVRWSANP